MNLIKAIQYVEAGLSRRQIGKQLGVDGSTVTYHLKRHGYVRTFPRSLPGEKWKRIDGYSKYFISSKGRVFGPYRKILKQFHDGGGYPFVVLSLGRGKTKTTAVHFLVAHHFISVRPKGLEVNHKDTIKTNCDVSNLEYITSSQNKRHAIANGLWANRLQKRRATIRIKHQRLIA